MPNIFWNGQSKRRLKSRPDNQRLKNIANKNQRSIVSGARRKLKERKRNARSVKLCRSQPKRITQRCVRYVSALELRKAYHQASDELDASYACVNRYERLSARQRLNRILDEHDRRRNLG